MLSVDDFVDVVYRLQMVWRGIHGRCNLPTQRSYSSYGAKGINLCQEWSGLKGQRNFTKWAIKNGWKDGLVVDRIENAKIYSPETCRIVTQQVNCWNKTNNRKISHLGETKCVAEWGNDPRCVVPSSQFQQRIKCGWTIERALTTPLRSWGPGRKTNG